MRSQQLFRTIWFAGCCLILAACGDSTAPKLTPVTVDGLLAELNDVAALGAPAMSLAGTTTASTAAASQSCAYNSANQRFVCDAVTTNGVTINRYYQLLDGSGAALSSFDVTKVAAMRNVTDVAGTVQPPAGVTASAATITAHDDGTLSGLLTGTHTLNSTGTSSVTMTVSGQAMTVSTEQTTTNLVLPKRGDAKAYPKGTIAMKITTVGGPVGFAVPPMNITMTFNGTSTATFTMTTAGFTQTCTLDLSNQSSLPSCTK